MKIFVSHQQKDSATAGAVASRLRSQHGIEVYLDLIDPDASGAGDLLGEHLRTELGKCTHLLAVVSSNTKESWWVPWEIGIATEKEYPISTYADGVVSLPEYLKRWPYLTTALQLDTYAREAKRADQTGELRKAQGYGVPYTRREASRAFHSSLKAALGQRDIMPSGARW